MRCFHHVWTLLLLAVTTQAGAHDLSLLSGFYRSSKIDPGLGQSEISIGTRYALKPSADQSQWFIRAKITSVSYSGDNAPDGGLNLELGGGKLYFLKKFSSDIRSYIAWDVYFLNSKVAENNTTEVESNGLLYGGHAGFRFDLSKALYFDVDAKLFESALTAKTTTRNTAVTPAEEKERSQTEIYVQSFTGLDAVTLGLGYLF